jgi:hypothetical protein
VVFTGVLPAPLVEIAPFGLLSAANVVDHSEGSDSHWMKRMDVETDACYFNADIYDICNSAFTASILDATAGSRSNTVFPFAITAVDKCSTTGFAGVDREQRVLRQLDLVTQRAVETELWGGTLALAASNNNRFITYSSGPLGAQTVGTALSPRRALAALENALAGCGAGARGMIHAPRQIVSLLENSTMQETVGTGEYASERLVTKLGTIISAGVGYNGNAPNNAAPSANRKWMYATGPVTVHLGPKAVVGDASAWIDESINDLSLQAERGAAVVWDGCCHFAVEVDITA